MRSDIAFAVSYLGQFNNCFGTEHWKATTQVLRYLRGTFDLGLREQLGIYQGIRKRRLGAIAMTGDHTQDIFFYSTDVLCPEMQENPTIALSTSELEYMVLTECAKNSNSLNRLTLLSFAIVLKLAENSMFHSRSKHIDLCHYFVRDVIQSGQLIMEYITSE
ncbi:hypothetical protein ACFW04_004626 [Cataglyphis niger]